jgi:glycosyltransferase involved in cell wall biosynthesis
MEQEIFRAAPAVVAVSGRLKQWIVSLGADANRVHVIPNAVSEALFTEIVAGGEVRERHGLNGRPVVGFLGSFQPWHDVQGLLRAFARLHEQTPKLRLLLVGNGASRQQLERQAEQLGVEDDVIFAGNVPHELVPQYLASMDVVVAPYDGRVDLGFFPIKLFEYMAAGKATVAAAIGQIGDFIDHGRTGWLYAAGDDDQLAEGLARLLSAPDLRAAIGQAAREEVLANHTWNAAARRVVDVARTLIAR